MTTVPNAAPSVSNTDTVDQSLVWVADLLASLDLPPMALDSDDPDDPGTDEAVGAGEASIVDATPEEISQSSQDLSMPEFDYDPEEDGSVLDALFGWIGDLLTSLFGGPKDGEDMADTPVVDPSPDIIPADVAEDLIMNPVEPDQDYLDQLEAELEELELDLL